jgi:hypothetical protein
MNNALALIFFACISLLPASASATNLNLPRDGWASWQIETIANAPNWCCFDWNGPASSKPAACNLDGPKQGYSNSGKDDTTAQMRVYALFNAGKLERIQTLATSCQVTSKTAIKELVISEAASIAWLDAVTTNDVSSKAQSRFSADAIAALAVHRGTAALSAVQRIASKGSQIENRKAALFWLGQVRGEEGAPVVAAAMSEDASTEVRKHAAFSMAQSQTAGAAQALIKQGRTDQSTDVRSQAWFWLAKAKLNDAEAAIQSAVRNDKDEYVRKKAVFALSQLPPDRAIASLITIAEDKSLDRETRKQAVFWIGQSKSDQATAYLDRVLEGKR